MRILFKSLFCTVFSLPIRTNSWPIVVNNRREKDGAQMCATRVGKDRLQSVLTLQTWVRDSPIDCPFNYSFGVTLCNNFAGGIFLSAFFLHVAAWA